MKTIHNNFLNLAFNLAKINLGKTKNNPSVGCVVVKNGFVLSSGYTSMNGRPHAEFNTLNKKGNFSGSDLYVTMEPCIHYGLTPPCTNIIKKKKINRVFYSFNDVDKRSAKKSSLSLKENNIKVYKKENFFFKDFYQSYYINRKKNLPLVDAKLALSKDYYTVNKKNKWITNYHSRKRAHLIRSEYDCIISTSKSINKDNSLLNCRLDGFNTNKPDLIIIDLKLKIKSDLSLFNLSKRRKILLVTTINKCKKISFLKKKGVKFIQIKSLKSKKDFLNLFQFLKKRGFNRILVESGLLFLNQLISNKLICNLYLFKTSTNLGKYGFNNTAISFIKKLKTFKKIKVNLYGDHLYKIKV